MGWLHEVKFFSQVTHVGVGDSPFLFGVGVKGGFALGELDDEAFAIHTATAEAGKGLNEADKGLGVLLEGLGEGGGIKGGEELADAEGGDLLGCFVEFSIIVFANEVKEELDLGLGIFAALLLGEPDEVAGFFPAGEIVTVDGLGARAQASDDVGVGDALAEHLINFLADLGREFADFVAWKASDGGEVARARGGGWRRGRWGRQERVEIRLGLIAVVAIVRGANGLPKVQGELGAEGFEAARRERAMEPAGEGELIGRVGAGGIDIVLRDQGAQEAAVGRAGQFLDGEQGFAHGFREESRRIKEQEHGVVEGIGVR